MNDLNPTRMNSKLNETDTKVWFKAAPVEAFPLNGGACIRYKNLQVAIFNFARRNEWYACQNECPHKMQMALSRGIIGTSGAEPKVACPFHKRTFSLKTGACLNAEDCVIRTYPVRIADGYVYVGFPE
jgi:nitrite reductase (NADH) small subunit